MDSQSGLPYCRTGPTWNVKKNTGFLADALGPFPDEPIISAVDKSLLFSCDLYYSLMDTKDCVYTLYQSDPIPECCPVGKVSKKSSSKVSIIDLSNVIEKPLKHRIFHSCTDLTQLGRMNLIKASNSKSNINKTNPCMECRNINHHQWCKTKNANGTKIYEIWTDNVRQKCPSLIFILPPNGEAIPFESVHDQ